MSTATLLAQPALLSAGLQDRARRYVAARRRSGEALLEAVAELAAARAEALPGQWGVFLEAVGLDETSAKVQLQIATRAAADSAFAERIRVGFFSLSTAREFLTAPADVQHQVLDRPLEEPPTRAELREAKGAPAHPAPPPAPSPAQQALIDAQNAAPGSEARAAALTQAKAAIRMIDDTPARDALATRWRALHAEHGAAIVTQANMPTPEQFVRHGDQADALTAAGWQASAINPLLWFAPGEDANGDLTTIEFDTPDQIGKAAAIVAADPTITAEVLAARLDDPIPLDVRVLADAYGLLMKPASDTDGFFLYWPDEEDEVANFMPFDATWAREWLIDGAIVDDQARVPGSLYNRALAAGWRICGAHAEGRLIVMPLSDETHTVTEELTPAALEARIAGDGRSIDGLPHPPLVEPDPIISAAQRTAEASAGLLEANRDNPAYAAGATWQEAADPVGALLTSGDLHWQSVETRATAARLIRQAIKTLPEPVARLLVLATATIEGERMGALSYHRVLCDTVITAAVVQAGARYDRESDLLAMLLDMAESEAAA